MANTPTSVPQVDAERTSRGTVSDPGDGDLNLLLSWPDDHWSSRWRITLALSVLAHFLVLGVGMKLETLVPRPYRQLTPSRQTVTHLYLPPDLLTQRDPNRGKLSKTFDLADLLASQRAQQRTVASAPGKVRRLELPKQPKELPKKQVAPQIAPEPPAPIEQQGPPPPGVPDSVVAAAPPPPAPSANPTPSLGIEEPQAQTTARLAPPKNSLQDVIRQMAKPNANSSQLTISDEGVNRPLPTAPGQQATQGRMSSAIELKTDPQGADFKPYLTRILAIVRRNWFSVLPDSAHMGVLRGRTTVQFVVNRDGSIPKLVIADASGLQPLDRAAVAGLSMSNPLPPLPPEFKGGFIRLQFSFNYNVPTL